MVEQVPESNGAEISRRKRVNYSEIENIDHQWEYNIYSKRRIATDDGEVCHLTRPDIVIWYHSFIHMTAFLLCLCQAGRKVSFSSRSAVWCASQEDFDLGTDQEEQETAWATNFSAVAIVEEEEDLIPSEAHELKYVNVSFCSP
jgi:hypothetical protein